MEEVSRLKGAYCVVVSTLNGHTMKLGVSAFAWTARLDASCLQYLEGLRARGIDAVEIPMFDPANLPVRDLRSALESEGLNCTVCAILPHGLNPISQEPSERRAAADHLTRCVTIAAELGASLIGGPLYAPIGYIPEHRPTQEQWYWAVEVFQGLTGIIEQCHMTLAVEPVSRSETSFLRTAADAKRLCESVGHEQFGVTLDTFHANIEELSIPRAIESLGSQLKHVHMSENDRGPLGRGHIPFASIVSALERIGYQGHLMIEGFGYSPEQISAPGWLWAPTDVTPEVLVDESTRYLAGVLAGS